MQPRGRLEQLADPAGLRQRAVPDVVLDVELLVVLPDHCPAVRIDRCGRFRYSGAMSSTWRISSYISRT